MQDGQGVLLIDLFQCRVSEIQSVAGPVIAQAAVINVLVSRFEQPECQFVHIRVYPHVGSVYYAAGIDFNEFFRGPWCCCYLGESC